MVADFEPEDDERDDEEREVVARDATRDDEREVVERDVERDEVGVRPADERRDEGVRLGRRFTAFLRRST